MSAPIDETVWDDTRERNDKNYLNSEGGIVWPWECRAVYDRYTVVRVNVIRYFAQSSYYGIPIKPDFIGEKIGDYICEGYDDISGESHTIDCSVYSINNVDRYHVVAVKYEGYDEYYPFKCDVGTAVPIPGTLGVLIDKLNLTDNVKLNDFYYEQKDGDVHYALSDEHSEAIWNMILKYADAKTNLEYEEKWNRKIIGFSLDSDVLGIKNLSLSLNQEGYLITNIEDYGYYYNIGVDAVNEIVDFAMKHRLAVLMEETQYLVGTVTEIGENYIKVDDSVAMKNPEDGIVFTVYADHMNIKRYIISGYLKVGDTVRITHGFLSKESYTEIKNATDLQECVITSGGQVLIPE